MRSPTRKTVSVVALLVLSCGLAAGPADAKYDATPTKAMPGGSVAFDLPGVMKIAWISTFGFYLFQGPGADWSCYDNVASANVGSTAFLAGPMPSVSCTPPIPGGCNSVIAGSFSMNSGGTLSVTSECSGLSTTFTAPANTIGTGPSVTGAGSFAWTCEVDDSALSPAFLYLATCGVNQDPPSPGNNPTLPDTSCQSAVGLGPSDIPHVYTVPNSGATAAMDMCPDHYSGELGYAAGGAWLFSREGSTADPDGVPIQGSGATACYGTTNPMDGPTTGHHGAHTSVHVADDQLGGNVGYTVARDWSRTIVNNGPGNADNGAACGDGLVEPCNPPFLVEPACNHLDATIVVPAGSGPVNVWTIPSGDLEDFSGADGAVIVFLGASASTGRVWTT